MVHGRKSIKLLKIGNCKSLYDMLEDRSTRYRKSMKQNFCKGKMYKKIEQTFAKH